MNKRLQHAIASIAAVAERAGHLTDDEQETLAVRLETFAEGLYWEQWFGLPERFWPISSRPALRKVAADALQPRA